MCVCVCVCVRVLSERTGGVDNVDNFGLSICCGLEVQGGRVDARVEDGHANPAAVTLGILVLGRRGKRGNKRGGGTRGWGAYVCVCASLLLKPPSLSLSLSLALSLSNPLTWMARAPISSAGMRPLSCLLRSVLIGVDGC